MRILVIGAGSIGSIHATNAAALTSQVAVFDQNTENAKKVASNNNIEVLPSIEEALNWKADGVVIATPHDTHIAMANKFVASGSHVLIEKPIAHEHEGINTFLDKAEAAKRKVFVACNMRYHPAIKLLKKNIKQIGTIHFARAWFGNYLPNMRPDADYKTLYCSHRSKGGGVILDGIHEVDYLQWILGDVTAVSCEAAKLSDLDIDVEDYAATILRHTNGARSEIHQDYLQQFKRRGCEIVGSQGTLIWNSEGKNPENCTVRLFLSSSQQWQVLYENNDLDSSGIYKEMLGSFISAIDTDRDPADLLTGRQAAHDLEIVLAAHKSAQTGKVIEFKGQSSEKRSCA